MTLGERNIVIVLIIWAIGMGILLYSLFGSKQSAG